MYGVVKNFLEILPLRGIMDSKKERKDTMQVIISAYDGTDPNALARRMEVRPRHLENMKKVMEQYKVLCAGGITNDEGTPIGSFLVMEFPDREALDGYLATEPYITEKVWQEVRVEPCNAVIVGNEMGQ